MPDAMKDMRRFAAIDQGNSLIKLTLLEGGKTLARRRYSADDAESLFTALDLSGAECGAFCSVGRIDTRMVESLRLALGGKLLVLSRSTALPLEIDYGTPGTLGLDRIALSAGAAWLYPGENVAVADAGTAVTLDVVDATPAFRGGRITAGLRLRFEALHSHTAALPPVDADGDTPLAGYSTETAIRSGVVLGLADEITETFRIYRERYGCGRLLLTGGDAGVLFPHITTRISADHVPDLMALGLLYIFKHNEI